jgi:NADH-quinone oxidoreductase subunit J
LVNIVVYAGAIMVLFLFVVMFLNLNKETEHFKSWLPLSAAIISGGCVFLIFLSAYKSSHQIEIENTGGYQLGLVENLGEVLYRDYLFPMEVCSVLFLVAMIGVVLLSRKEKLETSNKMQS